MSFWHLRFCSLLLLVCHTESERIAPPVTESLITPQGVIGNATHTYSLPDGDWKLEIDREEPFAGSVGIGVSVHVADSAGNAVTLLDIPTCGEDGDPLRPGSRRLSVSPDAGDVHPADANAAAGAAAQLEERWAARPEMRELMPMCNCNPGDVGDGICDQDCNNPDCNYDAGPDGVSDCCPAVFYGKVTYSVPVYNFNAVGDRPAEVFPVQEEPARRTIGFTNVIVRLLVAWGVACSSATSVHCALRDWCVLVSARTCLAAWRCAHHAATCTKRAVLPNRPL